MSALFYLSAFTLVVFYWAETFHKNYYESSGFLPRLGMGFLALNVIVYTYQIIMLVLWDVKAHEEREGNVIYELNIVLDVAISALLSLGFLLYGILMFFLTKSTGDGAIEDRNRELLKTVGITTVFAACFLCRVVMFAYRPITGQHFPAVTFYVLGYFLPELIPSVLQVYLAESTQEKQDKDNKFIDSLYAEGEEAIEEYRSSMRYSHVPINRVRSESEDDGGTHDGSPLLRAV